MLRIIVLEVSVMIRIHLMDEWHKGSCKYVPILCCIYYPALCGTFFGNASPHMQFWRVLVLILELPWSLLSEAFSAVALQLKCRLICENDIFKASFSSICLLHQSSCFSLFASQIAWQYLAVVNGSCLVVDILCSKFLCEDILKI